MKGVGVILQKFVVKDIEITISVQRKHCRVIKKEGSVYLYWNRNCLGNVTLTNTKLPESEKLDMTVLGYFDLLKDSSYDLINSWLPEPKRKADLTKQIINVIALRMLFPVRDDADPNGDKPQIELDRHVFVKGQTEFPLDRYGRPLGKYKTYVSSIPIALKREHGGEISLEVVFKKSCPYAYDAASITDFTVSCEIEVENADGDALASSEPHFTNLKRAVIPVRMKQWLKAVGVSAKEIEEIRLNILEQWRFYEMVVDQILQDVLNKKLKPK